MGLRILELTILAGLLVLVAVIEGQQKDHSWSGYYTDNGKHYLLYGKPREELIIPTFGNISSNPFINDLEAQESLPTRIVNGVRIPCEEAPFQGSLHYEGYFVCGCVIINRIWVITAHHCYFGPPGKYTVRVGSDQQRRGGQLRHVQRIVAISAYNDYTMQHDLAMMKLKSPIFYGKCVQPVRLPSPTTKRFPKTFVVSGWGITSVNAQNAQRYLRRVTLNYIKRGKCQKKYKSAGIKIYKDMICASRKNKDSCSGDSGGPLTNKGVLYGIVSWGIGCANKKYPGVYVNVKRYIRWIKRCLHRY
ncbi:trypsin alpha-3 [Drosophila eugracilis]|uniref:trypsin alpha-3 n=1 Tax=Drosophila eugracilis TaxID=29029 RepID=UPI0007E84068|nr:trypsin alpha-3 [Drosophila eugracilis]